MFSSIRAAIENVLKRMECGESPHVQALEKRRDERRRRREEAEEVDRLRQLQMEENERQRQRLAEMERVIIFLALYRSISSSQLVSLITTSLLR